MKAKAWFSTKTFQNDILPLHCGFGSSYTLTCRLAFDYIRQRKKQKAKTDFVAHCWEFLYFMFICFFKIKINWLVFAICLLCFQMMRPENFQEALAIAAAQIAGCERGGSWLPVNRRGCPIHPGLSLSPARGVGSAGTHSCPPFPPPSPPPMLQPDECLLGSGWSTEVNEQIYYHLYVPLEPAF